MTDQKVTVFKSIFNCRAVSLRVRIEKPDYPLAMNENKFSMMLAGQSLLDFSKKFDLIFQFHFRLKESRNHTLSTPHFKSGRSGNGPQMTLLHKVPQQIFCHPN